jgi:hypothetical protein
LSVRERTDNRRPYKGYIAKILFILFLDKIYYGGQIKRNLLGGAS